MSSPIFIREQFLIVLSCIVDIFLINYLLYIYKEYEMKKICILLALLLVLTSCQLFSFLGEKATGNLCLEIELDDDTPSAVSVIYENSKSHGSLKQDIKNTIYAYSGYFLAGKKCIKSLTVPFSV